MRIFHSLIACLLSVVLTKTAVGGTVTPSTGNGENQLLASTSEKHFPTCKFSNLSEAKDLPLQFVNIQQVNCFEYACETDLFKE